MNDLVPDNIYYFSAGFKTCTGKVIFSKIQHKIRSAPKKENANITFVSGGDIEWSEAGIQVISIFSL